MCANQVVKRNISGMQVIKTLQLLLEGDYSMQELTEKLNKNEKEPIFNNSVVSKYINTCRYCGIEIPKIHNRYFVSKLPFGLTLETKDYELISLLQLEASKKLNAKTEKLFNNFIRRLNQYSNKDIIRVEKKTTKLAFELFERAVQERRKILLMFRAKSFLECIPLAIVEQKNKFYFKVLHNNKERLVSVDRISGMKVQGKVVSTEEPQEQEVVFILKGELGYRYTLREHETEIARKLPEFV